MKYTYDFCKEFVLNIKSKKELMAKKFGTSIYNTINKNRWIDLITHFETEKKPKFFWTKEKCAEEALKYKTRSEFQKNSYPAYNSSKKNGWFDEICKHMITYADIKASLTKEQCYEESKKYNNWLDFRKGNRLVYNISCENKWNREFYPRKNKKTMTKEQCYEESKKYTNCLDFKKGSRLAYNISCENKWNQEFFYDKKGTIK